LKPDIQNPSDRIIELASLNVKALRRADTAHNSYESAHLGGTGRP
jgi:hypothetical protein